MQPPHLEECKADILIIDDREDNLSFLESILSLEKYRVRCAIDTLVALDEIKKSPPDLILLNANLYNINGSKLYEQLKQNTVGETTSIIFIASEENTFNPINFLENGLGDYITQPFSIPEILARVKNQILLKKSQEKLENINDRLETLNAKLSETVINSINDLELEITERRRIQKKLFHLAMHDALTNLPNRTSLREYLDKLLEARKQYLRKNNFVILFFDCDNFKLINDSLGNIVGDKALIAVARRLEKIIPPDSKAFRLGGDEFIVVIENVNKLEKAIVILEDIQSKLNRSFLLGDREIHLNFSVGIVLENNNHQLSEQLLRDADIAMYQAKKLGKGKYKVFDITMYQRVMERLQLEIDLPLGISKKEFILHYQPIICLQSNLISGFEALVRWKHPELGLISPAKFIPVAEETETIIPLGLWVLKEACQQLKRWQKIALNPKIKINTHLGTINSFKVAVNLSVKQLNNSNLDEEIEKILEETGIDRQDLKLEVTESVLMENVDYARTLLKKISSQNIKLALDDFGTGYSSLKYLHTLPIDTLKIDRSFIQQITKSGKNRKIVKATINLAHTLDIDVVAEGVETKKQLKILKELGCNYAQGYLFARPMNNLAIEDLLFDN